MLTLEKLNRPLYEMIPYRKTHGTFGVEIECEGMNLPNEIAGWEYHKEGSLRGEGAEYVTKGAVTREGLDKCMDYMKRAFERHGTVVNEDCHRASTHIHVNMQSHTAFDVFGAVTIFALLEPVFMRLCGPNRDGNLFCLPSYDCGDLPHYIRNALQYMIECETVSFNRERGKYASLNLNPLRNFGSIEFRTFPCSIQKAQILQWADWCKQFVDVAAASKDKTFYTTIDRVTKNPVEMVRGFFGKAVDDLSEFEIHQLVQIGAENAYECSAVLRRFIEYLERKAA